MAIGSHYPSGFDQGITIRGVPLHLAHPGEVFFVNNSGVLPKGGVGGSDGNPGTYHKPFSTIDYAIGRCTASRGDVIFVMPGHTETMSQNGYNATTDNGITMDTAGVALVGLGMGNLRPTLTLDTANTAAIDWSADQCSMRNFRFVGNFLSTATAILNNGGRDWTVEYCDFSDTSAILGLLSAVTTTVSVNADNGYFANNRRVSIATTTPGTAVVIAGTTSGLYIGYNDLWMEVLEENVAVVLDHGALVVSHALMEHNTVHSINIATDTEGFLISTSAVTGSGICRYNQVRGKDPGSAVLITATAIQWGMFENFFVDEAAMGSGVIVPARVAN